jgi:homopolymeric O-antigen transport system ATP-binding protein
MSDVAIRVEGLSKRYRIGGKQERYSTLRDTLTKGALRPFRAMKSLTQRSGHTKSQVEIRNSKSEIWALRNVSFEVKPGEVIGVIGRNGAGKSTLLKILSRITEPTEGYAEIHGSVGSLLEVGTGFHPELTGRENIYLNSAILGMKRVWIERKFDEIVAFAEVEKFIDTPVKHYSSGMYLRLAFAVAAHLAPEILLVDEVLAVGDAAFQKKCLGTMEDLAQQGQTVLFVSHNMGAIRALCTKGILLVDGGIDQCGDIDTIIEAYYRAIGALQNGNDRDSGPITESRSRFGRISINDGRGNTIQQSKAFQTSTTLSLTKPVSGFSLFCILEDMLGKPVFHLREESPTLGLGDLVAGDYAITLKLPALWLNPGLYSIYFKVLFWGEYASARHVSDKFPLDVCGVNSAIDSMLHPQALWLVQ